ncbi:MAG: aminopeptidase [Pseudomonadota bacterium]
MSSNIKIAFAVVFCILLAACESLQYYGQAVNGQFYIFSHRKPIADLLQDSATSPALKARLESINRIRAFAANRLHLPLGNQYSTYVDLERPYVVWNVFAAPEFSMQPLSWCYPVAGCASYRGYFNEGKANEFAASLEQEGYEIFVGGVAAYSTLGWFSDSVLNTIVNRAEYELAGLIFHELAHQVVYIPGETEFNESFATTVQLEGLQRWLEANDAAPEVREEIAAEITLDLMRQKQFTALVQAAVSDLKILYAGPLAEVEKRLEKNQRITRLRDDYALLKNEWHGYGGYDAWFARDLNNAQLATVATYNSLVPAFNAMLSQANGDLDLFYQNVMQLKRLTPEERQQKLQMLMAP